MAGTVLLIQGAGERQGDDVIVVRKQRPVMGVRWVEVSGETEHTVRGCASRSRSGTDRRRGSVANLHGIFMGSLGLPQQWTPKVYVSKGEAK